MSKLLINSRSGTEVYIGNYPKYTFTAPGVVPRNLYSFHEERSLNDCNNTDKIIADTSVKTIVASSLKEDRKEIEDATQQSATQAPIQNESFKREIPENIEEIEDHIETETKSEIKGGSGSPKFKVIRK